MNFFLALCGNMCVCLSDGRVYLHIERRGWIWSDRCSYRSGRRFCNLRYIVSQVFLFSLFQLNPFICSSTHLCLCLRSLTQSFMLTIQDLTPCEASGQLWDSVMHKWHKLILSFIRESADKRRHADVSAQIKYSSVLQGGGRTGFKGWTLILETTQILSKPSWKCWAAVTHLPEDGWQGSSSFLLRAAAGDI